MSLLYSIHGTVLLTTLPANNEADAKSSRAVPLHGGLAVEVDVVGEGRIIHGLHEAVAGVGAVVLHLVLLFCLSCCFLVFVLFSANEPAFLRRGQQGSRALDPESGRAYWEEGRVLHLYSRCYLNNFHKQPRTNLYSSKPRSQTDKHLVVARIKICS